ncbi:MAG: MBL fold metallo-hydrolase, partial [Clostridia bacterium]|nr:MBL fold metallo-hydrolase [Clostridia bacterium]
MRRVRSEYADRVRQRRTFHDPAGDLSMNVKILPCGPLSVNTYIVSGNAPGCLVIDPGDEAPVTRYLEANGLSCSAILLTHGH